MTTVPVLHEDTSYSHGTIESAMPLLQPGISQDESVQERQNHRQRYEDDDDSCTTNNASTSTMWCWNFYLFLAGVFCSILLLGISLVARTLMHRRYHGDLQMPSSSFPVDSGILDQIVYAALFCLAHLWELFFPAIGGTFLFFLSSKANAKRTVQAITGLETITIEQSDVAYIMLVSLQGGFLVGCRLVGLVIELFAELPVSLGPFPFTIVIDLVVCSLVVLCYEGSKKKGDDDDESNEEEQKQCPGVAIL